MSVALLVCYVCGPPGVFCCLTRSHIRTYKFIHAQTANLCTHILPHRTLHLHTEMGLLTVAPHEIMVLPRGIRFQVELEGPSRGYVLEVFQGHFQVYSLREAGVGIAVIIIGL